MTTTNNIQPGSIVRGPTLPEPIEVLATVPHKGDAEHFRRSLALLDPDVYGNIKSLQRAMEEHEAPFYLRRTKEALVTFPDPETNEIKNSLLNARSGPPDSTWTARNSNSMTS